MELIALHSYLVDINKHTCLDFVRKLPEQQEVARKATCGSIHKSISHVISLILNARKRYCNWDQWVSNENTILALYQSISPIT